MIVARIPLLLGALAVAGPALAQAAADPVPAPVKEKMVCRSEEVIGSNIPQRTCHTAADWKTIATATERGRNRDMTRADFDQRQRMATSPSGQ